MLPQTAKQKPRTARVVAIGDSAEVRVSEGDLVIYARYSGTNIKLDDEDHLVLGSDDLLGVVEE